VYRVLDILLKAHEPRTNLNQWSLKVQFLLIYEDACVGRGVYPLSNLFSELWSKLSLYFTKFLDQIPHNSTLSQQINLRLLQIIHCLYEGGWRLKHICVCKILVGKRIFLNPSFKLLWFNSWSAMQGCQADGRTDRRGQGRWLLGRP
jgi:hypothetical protein